MACPLLDALPVELRVQIYEYALRSDYQLYHLKRSGHSLEF